LDEAITASARLSAASEWCGGRTAMAGPSSTGGLSDAISEIWLHGLLARTKTSLDHTMAPPQIYLNSIYAAA
jgi:hypothetical protein